MGRSRRNGSPVGFKNSTSRGNRIVQLLPEEEWPKVPPKSKVHATDSEWYALVKEGVERKIF